MSNIREIRRIYVPRINQLYSISVYVVIECFNTTGKLLYVLIECFITTDILLNVLIRCLTRDE